MKLERWASIAEIVSGIAVVVTLIFLVLGIRANTDVTRVSVYSDLIDSLSAWERDNYQSPELSRMASAFFAGETSELDENDRARVRRMAQSLFRIYEKAFFSRQYGVIGDSEWDRFERNICANVERAEVSGVNLTNREIFTDDFNEFLVDSCGARLP